MRTVELGLVGGHRVGDGHIRHEISGGTAGMTIIRNDVQAKAGVSGVNRADGAGVALFLNNSDLVEEGGSCPAERMMPGDDVVASNEAALEVVPLSVDTSPQAQRRERSWTSASPNLHLKAMEMAGLDKVMA